MTHISTPNLQPAESDPERNATASGVRQWGPLVDRIRQGDQDALSELYLTFSRGIRYYLCRHLGSQELDDKVHDTFLIVVRAIQKGDLREPDRLMGFVRTVVRRQVAAHIDDAVQARKDFTDIELGSQVPDHRGDPEQRAIRDEKAKIMLEVLDGVSRRDREILSRFYLHEETQQQICEEMHLTENKFRLLKSRAKARFGEIGRRKLASSAPANNLLRKAAGAGH